MTGCGKIVALIPAAGYSSRMGRFKPLLPLGTSTVIQEAVERFRLAGIEDVRVIIGHKAGEIAPVLDRLGVAKIFNSDYARGMFSSVLAGLQNLEPEVDAFFLLPADIPLVKPRTINALAGVWRSSGAGIVYPRFEGVRGHPPLISKNLVAELPNDFEGGLMGVLGRHEEQAVDLDVIDQSILMDCNTPEDYRRLQAYALREDIPTERECKALWNAQGLSDDLIVHCRLVAELAGTLAVHLKCAGLHLNTDLIAAGGLLHDLAKGQPDHSRAAAVILEKLGYGRVARIVAAHTDIRLKRRSLDESALVHLADKYVKNDLLVSLEERFEGPLKKFAGKPDILKAIEKRFKDAKTIRKRLTNISGVSVEAVVRRNEKSLRMASKGERRIYLVRHGAIRNRGNVKRYIGHTDLPLNAAGVRQAETLGKKLQNAPLAAVYCSDLRRAADTARIIAKFHGLEPAETPSFREVDLGDWEGLTFDEARRRFPVEFEERGRDILNFRPPGGESFLDCACRVISALYEALRATRGNILIVGHAGVNRILLCQALGKSMNELFDIDQDYGCLNLIRYANFAFELEMLNETA
jgi:alpha-ribazole phosphatase